MKLIACLLALEICQLIRLKCLSFLSTAALFVLQTTPREYNRMCLWKEGGGRVGTVVRVKGVRELM
jgi:hypothetical protein